jgi:hypothetical protein
VTGLGRCQQRTPIARIEDQMADDVAEEMRSIDAPVPARCVAVK